MIFQILPNFYIEFIPTTTIVLSIALSCKANKTTKRIKLSYLILSSSPTTDVANTTLRDINKNITSDDCDQFLERPIDWDELVLDHPGLADEILQRHANIFPNVIPACHERRQWVENMIAVTDWIVNDRGAVSYENRTAIIHHFMHTAVSNHYKTLFMTSIKEHNFNTGCCMLQSILAIVQDYLMMYTFGYSEFHGGQK